MRLTRGLFLSALVAVLSAGGLIYFPSAQGQAAEIGTPAQLELLRNLSPEQREQILRGLTDGSRGGAIDTGGTQRRDETQNPRPDDLRNNPLRRDQRTEDQEEMRNGVPILKGEDWIIVKIALPPERPATQPNTPQGQQQAPGGSRFPEANPLVPNALPSANAPPTSPPTQQSPVQRAPELTAEEREKRQAVIDLVRNRNPYRLSTDGILLLPGFAGIALAGLTEFEATLRLQAEAQLDGFDVSVIRMPLRKIGAEALKPFGYDLFEHAPSTFAPVTNVPVPADYVVGPGDQLEVQLYGNQNRTLRLQVQRDGRINFPELGPINVGGQLFSRMRSEIESRVERQMIGVRASVSMGDTRSIRVFVVGEARYPGSYTISGLGTITSALFAAGGVKPIGSLRKIQLKRQNAVVRTFDLYDMLIRGDSTDDAKLLPGDVVFIPPVGSTVTVQGEVRRPAIYEAKDETTPVQIVDLAGGLTPQADTSKVSLTRINENRLRVVLNVNLTQQGSAGLGVRNGDILQVSRLKPTLDSGVVVEGYVHSPANYAYREGLRLTDVIRSVDELKPNADINYLMIRREIPPNREIAVLSADLGAALGSPGSSSDVLLMPRDRLIVFDLESSRDHIIKPILTELRAQSNFARPSEVVSVDGMVRVPGEYPLEPGMRVGDLVRAGGSLKDSAYGGKAELTRYRVVNGDVRRTEQLEIDLGAALRGDPVANVLLGPFDNLSVRQVPEWGSQDHVVLAGEVLFPGRYSIRRGETLKSVIGRAGGLTELAFPEGSVFTRTELKEREQKQLDTLASRLQSDLSVLALQGAAANQAQAGTALSVGQSLLTQVRSSTAVGRLVIDLPGVVRGPVGSLSDVVLRDGDRLLVPKFQQEVTVIGEVQTATSHLYRAGLSRDDYIAQSGGVTRRADKDHTYIVRANGSVVANEGGRWFSRAAVDIRAGDTVVVPLDTERMPALPFWQAVTQIIYNLAISAAAVNSF